jgi:hypothetical protein
VVEKTVTSQQLLEMKRNGAAVEFEKRHMVIEQFPDLLCELKTLIELHNERVKADLKRSQAQLEVLATLQALVRRGVNGSPPLDPIVSMLAEIRDAIIAKDD